MTPPPSKSDPAAPDAAATETRSTGRRRAATTTTTTAAPRRAARKRAAAVEPATAEAPVSESGPATTKRSLKRAAAAAAKAEGADAKAARAAVRATFKSAKAQRAPAPAETLETAADPAPQALAVEPMVFASVRQHMAPQDAGPEDSPNLSPVVPALQAGEPAAAAPDLADPEATSAPLAAEPALTMRAVAAPVDPLPTPQAPSYQTQPQLSPAPALRQPDPALPPMPGEVDDDEFDDDRPGGRRARRRARAMGRTSDPANYVVAPTAPAARMRPRHYGVIAAFVLMVVLPTISYSWYLWTRAANQYESDIGFGSRTEEGPSTFDFVGALTGAGQSGSKDMDILNQFVVSQELVAKIDAELDLKAMWSKAKDDPLNAFKKDGTIEDLVAFWERMVLVDYDTATGLMNLRVFAFDPADSQRIATSILRESTAIINKLSQTAQEDTTRYSRLMLSETEEKLAAARLAVLDFQVKNNIVDPSNVVSNQLSVVSTLVQELANSQVDLDMLEGTVPEDDPRLANLRRRLEVIQNRIAAERAKVGAAASPDQPGYATLLAEFERLKVEQDFAQQAYLSALAAHDQAQADAQKKTRYLATYVAPTLAEAPTAPNRPVQTALAALIGFLIWAVSVLTYYALRDRR